jgi:glycosyltransferase involved in cell wall biosynthesis
VSATVDQILERVSWMDWDEKVALFRGICGYIGEETALEELVRGQGGDIAAVINTFPSFQELLERQSTAVQSSLRASAGSTPISGNTHQPLRVASWPGPHYEHNPFIQIFCQGLQLAGAEIIDVRDPCAEPRPQADVLIIHWPEQVFWRGFGQRQTTIATADTLQALGNWKADGAHIVWLVHNLAPHDQEDWKEQIWYSFYRDSLAALVDAFLTLSPSTVSQVRQAIPALQSKPASFVWHPTYPCVARPRATRLATRRGLGVADDTRLIAFLGLVRPYKDVEELLQAFQSRGGNQRLLVAGKPIPDSFGDRIRSMSEADERILLVLRHLSSDEFCAYTAASDLVVIPLRNYLHSGSLVHAVSAGRRVLTSDAPFARDFQSKIGSAWIRLYEPPLTADMLLRAAEWGASQVDGVPPAIDIGSLGREVLDLCRGL